MLEDSTCFILTPLSRNSSACPSKYLIELQQNLIQPGHGLSRKRINGGINGGLINEISLESLEYRRDLLFPFSLLLNNTRPVGRQVTFSSLLNNSCCDLFSFVCFYFCVSISKFFLVSYAGYSSPFDLHPSPC